ncbi:penicillin-binding protein [Nocardioidaceae bacterium]|nr:penicillin-binding protein [Nocardioidaceae bacterium]
MALPRTAAVVAVTALTTGLLAACTGPDESEQSAQAYATALVAGLSGGDLRGVAVSGTDEATADLQATLGDLADRVGADVDVAGGQVSVEESRAVLPLTWTWDLAGETWRYRTRAVLTPLTEDGETSTDVQGRPRWTATWTPSWVHPALEAGDSLDVATQPAARGRILGADRPIVVDRDVVRLGIDKTRLDGADATRSARRLARAVDVTVGSYVEQVEASGDAAFVPALTVRTQGARDLIDRVEAIPGGLAFATTEPLAPTSDFAAPLIGRVGPVTAEILAESEESGGDLAAGDTVGLSGFQARYDEQLRGTDGLVVRRESSSGEVEALFDVPAQDGRPLRLTLDVRLQQQAQRILDQVPDAAGATALVALRPSDGAVLAVASGQGAEGLSTATFGAEPPGSTFKIVSALALLRAGLTPDSPLRCEETTVVDGRTFSNYDGYPTSALGRIDLRTALAQSCNTAFIGAADEIEPAVLADAAAALGFGVDHDMGYPVFFGSIPPPETQTEAAADLIGQGRLTASPVAMAVVAASVQAGGVVLPRLVEGVEVTPSEPTAPLTPAEQRQLRSMLASVVADGSGQVLQGVGASGAKTGTAEFGEPGPDGSLPTHAWMVATRGDLSVAAYVESGDSGSGTAGPLLQQLLQAAG